MASKESESQGYGLLISAVVAIVAIVGQVILFNSGGSTVAVVAGGPYYSDIGQAQARGLRAGRDAGGGVSYYDFNSESAVEGGQNSFRSPGSGLAQAHYDRYSGEQDQPHGYFGSDGSLNAPYAGDSQGSDSFNRGAYGKGVREGIERTTLPADSAREGKKLQLG